jgi:hypothetical protein
LYGCRNGEKKIVAYRPDGGFDTIAEGVSSNDLVVTSQGSIYFTDPPNEQVWYIDPRGEKRVVADGFRPNGIILWPREETLVVTDSAEPHLWTFRIETDGSLKFKERYYSPLQMPPGADRPGSDGMTVDKEGRLYVTTRAGLQMFDPTGRLGGVIAKPQNTGISNVCFGGPDFSELIVTSVDKVYRRKTKTAGAPYFLRAKKAAANGAEFKKVSGPAGRGAVLKFGKAGGFDADWVACPSVVFDGTTYRMWYSSLYDSRAGHGGIGLATSPDGLHWQRANDGRPVLSPGPIGALDDGQVMGPEVNFDGEVYRMWYTGMSNRRHESGIGYYRIFLATSDDGIRWNRENGGDPVLNVGSPGTWDAVQAATPSVLRDQGGFRMWYAAWSPEHNHTICCAESDDGIRWTRANEGRPVRGLEPSIAYGPAVCRLDGRYLLLYMALQAETGLYAAASENGTDWKMLNDGQPVLLRSQAGSFDDALVGHPFLLAERDRLRMWYTGYSRHGGAPLGLRLQIGTAEAIR